MRFPVSDHFTSEFSILDWLWNNHIALIDKVNFTGSWAWAISSFFVLWERRWGSNQQAHSYHYILSATPLWGSRLKWLRNKCYPSFCILNSIFHHILPQKTWHISQIMSGTIYPASNFTSDFRYWSDFAMVMIIIIFAIRQFATWASTSITHKHSQKEQNKGKMKMKERVPTYED